MANGEFYRAGSPATGAGSDPEWVPPKYLLNQIEMNHPETLKQKVTGKHCIFQTQDQSYLQCLLFQLGKENIKTKNNHNMMTKFWGNHIVLGDLKLRNKVGFKLIGK